MGGFYQRVGKRWLDITIVVVAAPLWVPLCLVVASTVVVAMGRPVLFRQQRPGRNGSTFTLVKFRTMTSTTDDEGEPLPDALRLTRLGALLRRTSLDELPELFNVLRGDMSLVGPRPLLVEYLPYYSHREARRHDVRPGLTGLAQINGRNRLHWDQRLELDVQYTETMSVVTDIKILVATAGKVLRGDDVAFPGTVSRSLSDERGRRS